MTKKDIQNKLRVILNSLKENEIVSNKEDENFLINYFKAHPDITEKYGVGFNNFICVKNKDLLLKQLI